jgi:predicted lactoylglutathione lyase
MSFVTLAVRDMSAMTRFSRQFGAPPAPGGFEFLDPEGNAWEVVWAEDTSVDERGDSIVP